MDKIAVFAPNIHYTRQKQATMNAIPRESYLNRIEHYPGKDTIIILTGQRRIGKSYLLRLFRDKVSRGRSMPMSFSSTRRSTVFWESRMSCRPLSRLCQFIFLRHPLWESRKIRIIRPCEHILDSQEPHNRRSIVPKTGKKVVDVRP